MSVFDPFLQYCMERDGNASNITGLGFITPDTEWNATAIAAVATAGIEYESVGKPILTIPEAIAAGSFFDNPGASQVKVGDAKGNYTYRYTPSNN